MVIVMFGAVGLKYHYIREERSEGGGGVVVGGARHSGDDGWRMFWVG